MAFYWVLGIWSIDIDFKIQLWVMALCLECLAALFFCFREVLYLPCWREFLVNNNAVLLKECIAMLMMIGFCHRRIVIKLLVTYFQRNYSKEV